MKLLKAVESFERSLVINDGVPTQFECDNLRVAARESATELAVRNAEHEHYYADLAALREALQAIDNDCTDYIDDNDGPGPVETMQAMRACARAALSRTERTQP